MGRQRKVVKTHFSYDQFTRMTLCGAKGRNITSKSKEVTCGNCLRKLNKSRRLDG